MSASAQEPVDPGPTRDNPTEDPHPKDAAAHNVPRADAPADDSSPAHPPKAGQQAKPNPILTSPNLETAPANARLEAQQLSWPPWQQQPHALAGDTTTADVHFTQSADQWVQPPDQPKPTRYATGLIIVATAAVAGTVSYLWSSQQGSNSPDRANLVSAAPSVPTDPALQPAARGVAESPALLPDS